VYAVLLATTFLFIRLSVRHTRRSCVKTNDTAVVTGGSPLTLVSATAKLVNTQHTRMW